MNQPLIPDLEIRQSNVLTNARLEYTELQFNLFFFILSKLGKNREKLVYELDIKEMSRLTGVKYDLRIMWEATDGMLLKSFWIKTAKDPEQLVMFQRIKYLTGTGIIEFELTRHILPYLFDLKEKFTSYGLAAALRLPSKYAKRIYPLCSQWKNLGQTKKLDIQEFKEMLGIPPDTLKAFKDFRVNVLDLAVKLINEHTELHIDYKLEKRGKSNKNILFKITSQALSMPIIDLDATPSILPGATQHQYENAAKILDGWSMAAKFRQIILNDPEHVMGTNRFYHGIKTGTIKAKSNPAGLLLTHLKLVEPRQKPA